ncbi:MAG: poly(A) polymerase [Desulfobulbaceae bacterium]|jgi:poly(A) polymerase|nr:poly(A) polymerase [Desulfobulbaceae bacterium]
MKKEQQDPPPRIVGVESHGITAASLDSDAAYVLKKLTKAGYKAYLVGGGVRDLYQGVSPKDFDLSTDASPTQVRKLFRNSRVIGRRFRLVQVFFHDNKIIELSTFRCRTECDDDKKGEVLAHNNAFGDEREDAFRRDLTINGLFYDIEQETIIDYVGGVQDLDDKVVRIIGNADLRIGRDPVRMMRAIRHAARSGFTIEPATWTAIQTHCDSLSVCPVSRIRDELFKDLHGRASGQWVRFAARSGLLTSLLPFYAEVLEEEGVEEELEQLLTAVDMVQSTGGRLKDDMLLAVLILPWARRRFPDLNTGLKTGDAFALSREIREHLKHIMAHLDIKRALKEQIATTLTLLPLFMKNRGKGWPKWLTKKSYFGQGLLFHGLVQQAGGGEKVAENLWPKPPRIHKKTIPVSRPKPRSKGSRAPAYTNSKSKGGVFGFRKG